MFERFTDAARRAVVLSNEVVGELRHDHLGTEHFLMGLLAIPDQPASRALATLGVTADAVRREIIDRVGTGEKPIGGHIPFTPHAKSALQRSLTESFEVGHSYIGTEHMLLGLLGEPDGLGAQILAARVGDLSRVRAAVLDLAAVTPPAGGLQGSAEAGRHRMHIRVADDRVTVVVQDPGMVEVARAAVIALGDLVDEPGTISGGLPAAASLAVVWQALRTSLDDIRRRATPPTPGA
ncbi:Clp protease N-terminal domain-containing protein [Mycobacterium sp. pUA109]|uniref:Clp protease N-terminal domain-containing protein n=1 Tax=Mycobacterium sp. pUA109 TaxID=3238982 RepID=UPI00351B6BFC